MVRSLLILRIIAKIFAARAAAATANTTDGDSIDVAKLTALHVQSAAQEFLPRVYIGPLSIAQNRLGFRAVGITKIVTLLANCDKECIHGDIVRYLEISIADEQTEATAGLIDQFPAINRFIDHALLSEPKSRVLIHCSSGISRSGAAAIAYVMHSTSQSLLASWHAVRAVRRFVLPNDSFFAQLCEYEKRLWNKRAAAAKNAAKEAAYDAKSKPDTKSTAAAAATTAITGGSSASASTATAKYVCSMTLNGYRAMSILATGVAPAATTYEQALSAVNAAKGDVNAALASLMS